MRQQVTYARIVTQEPQTLFYYQEDKIIYIQMSLKISRLSTAASSYRKGIT